MEVEKAMEVGTAAMEDRAGNSEKGHGEEGERIDRCPNGVELFEGAVLTFDFGDASQQPCRRRIHRGARPRSHRASSSGSVLTS